MSEQDSNANEISKQTTPTWEMELLISGATVFSLLQLPGPLNRATAVLMNSNSEYVASLISVVSIYLYVSLIALIGAFILHLIARGYWVAMVGMHSVYPQGISWGKMSSFGPAYRATAKENTLPIEQLIEQADNRATGIFGLGFGLAVSLAIPIIIVGSMLLVLLVVQYLGADIALWHQLLWLLFGALMAPWFVAYFCDYYFGEKLEQAGKSGWLKFIFRIYQKIGLGNGNNTVVSLFATNSNQKKIGLLIMIGGVLFTFAALTAIGSRGISFDNGAFSGLPRTQSADTSIIRPENYRQLRTEGQSLRLTPYIEEVVISGSYMRLFIPYQPSKFNEIIRRECPQALSAKSANKGDGLVCLSKYFNIQIDGIPVAVPLLAGEDADTGQRGLVAMIDARKLADGQHELLLKRIPRDIKLSKTSGNHHIPFWK